MTLPGGTLFAGDSITVGLPAFVQVDAPRVTVAKEGQGTAALLAMVRAEEAKGTLDGVKNMVVLGGTNDIGSSLDPSAIVGNLQAVWKIGKAHGLRVFALTIPPARGYTGWNGRDDAVDARRRTVNASIRASTVPDAVIDLDTLLGTSPDTGRLAPSADSGDHLHPRKDVMGTALTAALAAQVPNAAPSGTASSVTGLTAGKVVAGGGIGYGLYRLGKWWLGR